ncbi:hypothetical protein [Alkalibacillus salilacus]|uniref:Uncharacterized protein n=1 Tax=Alkalibacillus salilacus TaxID=284582 RepID=A0ABT9VCX2_9BACI|nr:hypothetical protein [Alkalibacillus salilacus]MDQ0158818.1 hypothetical protein [Alkalibacillus salilacus]
MTWEEKLQEKLESMSTSKKIENFLMVSSRFEHVYNKIIKPICINDKSFFNTIKSENEAHFFIVNCSLSLKNKSDHILVGTGTEELLVFGKIYFENGYSYYKNKSSDYGEYLDDKVINELFRFAYNDFIQD